MEHEAFLRLSKSDRKPEDEPALITIAAHAIRHMIVDHAEAALSLKRGRAWERLALESTILAKPTPAVDALQPDEALEGLEKDNQRAARVVEFRFYGDLTTAETANALGVSTPKVEYDWRFTRVWLAVAPSKRTDTRSDRRLHD